VGLGRRAGRRTRRVVLLGGREVKLPPLCAAHEGYNLHAGVYVGAANRDGLERLARYLCRPALSKTRLERRADGLVTLHMKRAWRNGTSSMVFSPTELVARLAALVARCALDLRPLFRFAAGLSTRRGRTPCCTSECWRPMPPGERRWFQGQPLAKEQRKSNRVRFTWSELLRRVFRVDGWLCRSCHRPMTLRAVVKGPPASALVFQSLQGSARAPPANPVPSASRA
jgi:hypothetical protein